MSRSAEFVDVRRASTLEHMEYLCALYTRHEFSKHMHDTHAYGVIDAGKGRVWCAGTTHLGVVGDVISIAPGVVHTGAEGPRSDDAPFRYRMIYPSHRLVTRTIAQLEFSHALSPRAEPMIRDKQVAASFKRLFSALRQEASSLEIDTLFLAFVAHTRSRPAERGKTAQSFHPQSSATPRVVTRVRDFLDANTHRNVRLEQLVQIANVHPLYLCRLFKAHVGLAPHAYALQARLTRARELLREGHEVSQVALLTGFADQSHFGRHFVKTVGATPASYRRMVSGGKDCSRD